MSDEVLEAYIRQTIEAPCIPEDTFAWQGGEQTLLGRDFSKKSDGPSEEMVQAWHGAPKPPWRYHHYSGNGKMPEKMRSGHHQRK
jgi:hypothetical protein